MSKLSRATLSTGKTTVVLPVNVYTANWGYKENAVSRDTIGGRVVQLLSVQVTDLTITSVAGGREELQRVTEGIREIMEYHISTLRPASFRVPSRAWDFRVYVTALPQVGWDVASTAYPYQLQMAVDEDLTGVKQREVQTAALDRLYAGIGYVPSVHGGDPKGFSEIVQTVLKASQGTGAPGSANSDNSDTGSFNGGSAGAWGGYPNGKIPYNAMTRLGGQPGGCTDGVGCYLEPTAAKAFKAMQQDYAKPLPLVCAYRSYAQQDAIWTAGGSDGTTVDGYPCAAPGTSNHGYGKAIDVSHGTEPWIWMMHNSTRFNWIPLPGDAPHFDFGR